jgi:hypothetical protein
MSSRERERERESEREVGESTLFRTYRGRNLRKKERL